MRTLAPNARFPGLWGEPGRVDRLVLDVDGVLFDTRPSFYAAARIAAEEVGGALSDDDIEAFKAAGGFNDDWHMARAAAAIVRWRRRTGDDRPLRKLLPVGQGLRGVLEWADDPGDLTDRCEALYEQLADREIALVDAALLRAVADRIDVCACTGRTRPQAESGFRRLDLAVTDMITCEVARKPDAGALLPLVESATDPLFLGDTVDDLKTVQSARLNLPSSTRLRFAWCLEATASEAQVERVVRLGADLVTLGPDPLLRALHSGDPS